MSVYEFIAEWCRAENITIAELARRAGIQDNLIHQANGVTPKGRPKTISLKTATALAPVMRVHVSQLQPPPGTRLYGRAAERPAQPASQQGEATEEALGMLRELLDIQREILEIARTNRDHLTEIDNRMAGAAERRRRA